MRTRWMIVFVLGALLALTQTASAQRRGGRGGFGRGGMMNNPVMLLGNPSVQKELNLTDEQKDKIKDAVQPVQEKMRSAFQGLRDVPQEERQEKIQAAMKEVNAASEEAMKNLKGVLKPEQEKRLHQIIHQQQGLTNPKIQEQLKLSDEQKSSIKSIVDDQQKELEGLQGRERFQKMAQLRKEGAEKMVNVLNDDQKKQWKDMTGKPFQMQFGRRGGRGRRSGGGGNPPPA